MDRRTFIQIGAGMITSAALSGIRDAQASRPSLPLGVDPPSAQVDKDIASPLCRVGVVAVGGAGTAIVNKLTGALKHNEITVMLDTNAPSLRQKMAGHKIAIDDSESYREQLATATSGLDLAFVVAGMGGKTGTRYAPTIAESLRKNGTLTLGVAILPFSFEGNSRQKHATTGRRKFGKSCDSLTLLPNQKLHELAGGDDASMTTVLNQAPQTFSQLYSAIAPAITESGLVGIDFVDVRQIFSQGGYISMGTGWASGNEIERGQQAAIAALHHPLFNQRSLNTAASVMLNVTWNPRRMKGTSIMKTIHEVVTEIRCRMPEEGTLMVAAPIDVAQETDIQVTVLSVVGDLGFHPIKSVHYPKPANVYRFPHV